MWQDIVLMLGGFGFAIALIPTVIAKKQKPSRLTCLLTSLILLSYAIVYFSLNLWLTVFSTLITTGLWITLLIQGQKK